MTDITTNLTPEQRLSHPVAFGNVTTFIALLTRPTRLDKLNANTLPSSLVRQKELQLPERPAVRLLAKLLVLLFVLGLLNSDVGQVFQDQSVASLQVGYNLFRDTVICVSTETVLLPREHRKVSFSRMSFALKDGPQSLITSLYDLNMLASVELTRRQDSRVVNPSVDADGFTCHFRSGNILLKNDVQENFVALNDKVSRATLPSEILLEVVRNSEVDFQTPSCC